MGALVSTVSLAFVPRSLGPAAYGNFHFLSSFFTQVVGFFDAGTSTSFYTRLSQKPDDSGLIRFYWKYGAALAAMVGILVATIYAARFADNVWPDQSPRYVVLAALLAIASWVVMIVNQVVDAHGLTVQGESIRVLQRVLSAVILVTLASAALMNLTVYFLYNHAMMALICILWWRMLRRRGIALFPQARATWTETRRYAIEMYAFAAPLFAYSIVAILTTVIDRWILQKVSGSIQQGHFGFSAQIAGVCLLFTGAMSPLFIRELSRAFAASDLARIRDLFVRHTPRFYFMAAFFSAFVSVEAKALGELFGGAKYIEASAAVAIMALYPIHQTYGQLGGTVFLATGQTKLYRNLGVTNMLGGIALTFFLLAPRSMGGLEAGAIGLAAKMVLTQFIGVSVTLWFIARYLKFSFRQMLARQISCLAALAAIGYLSTNLAGRIIPFPEGRLLLGGAGYIAFCLAAVVIRPGVFGLTRSDVTDLSETLRRRLRRA